MKKILIAEDDNFLASLLLSEFHNAGFDAMGAIDGVDAVGKVKSWTPDILLLDILMPNKDGYAVLEELRADPSFTKLPIIIFTNLGESGDIERVKKLGITDYLVKANTTPKAILEKVEEVLARV
ncbi:MAG TPA: response regulator [Candidatus Paceibacterota bacterium]|nr:response regulator [Candidatus Paceibacterota bacterium]